MLTPPQEVDKFGSPTFVSITARLGQPPTIRSPEKPMSSRFLILVLCVGAVAFACGPRAHNEASAPQKTRSSVARAVDTSAPVVQQQSAPRAESRKPSSTAVTAQFYVHVADSSVRFALHIVNASKKQVELTFPSGQTYDFVILDSLGREMWRWGNGRMFTQALRNKLLARGETIDLEETWNAATLPPGRYTARALLTSQNYPIVQQTTFTVTETTVASR